MTVTIIQSGVWVAWLHVPKRSITTLSCSKNPDAGGDIKALADPYFVEGE